MQKLNNLLNTFTNNQDITNVKLVMQEQISFLEDHIIPWVSMFSEATYNKGIKRESKLYPSAIIIMKEFIFFDKGLAKDFLKLCINIIYKAYIFSHRIKTIYTAKYITCLKCNNF